MSTEEWRPMIGYEGLYEVSSYGRIRSLYSKGTPKILKLFKTKGYFFVCLYKNKVPSYKATHSLVLEVFKGKRPAGYEAAHEDGICTNNHISNLNWKTKLENELDKIRHGHAPILNGMMNRNAKLTDDDVKKIKQLYKPRIISQRHLAEMFGVSEGIIFRILKGKIWRHIT